MTCLRSSRSGARAVVAASMLGALGCSSSASTISIDITAGQETTAFTEAPAVATFNITATDVSTTETLHVASSDEHGRWVVRSRGRDVDRPVHHRRRRARFRRHASGRRPHAGDGARRDRRDVAARVRRARRRVGAAAERHRRHARERRRSDRGRAVLDARGRERGARRERRRSTCRRRISTTSRASATRRPRLRCRSRRRRSSVSARSRC